MNSKWYKNLVIELGPNFKLHWENISYSVVDEFGKEEVFLLPYVTEKYGPLILPEEKDECCCTHPIVYNFWIIHKQTYVIKVVGSKCINKFKIDGGLGMKCVKCGNKHNNRNRKRLNENLEKHERFCNICREKDDQEKINKKREEHRILLLKERDEYDRLFKIELRKRQYFTPNIQKRKLFERIGGIITYKKKYYMIDKKKIDFAIEIGWNPIKKKKSNEILV